MTAPKAIPPLIASPWIPPLPPCPPLPLPRPPLPAATTGSGHRGAREAEGTRRSGLATSKSYVMS